MRSLIVSAIVRLGLMMIMHVMRLAALLLYDVRKTLFNYWVTCYTYAYMYVLDLVP